MQTHEFVLLVLKALGGEIKGKTKLQKSVYFLGIMTDFLDNLGYRPHFYGPYSDEVAHAVGFLRAIGVLDQNVVSGPTSQAGFEVRRHDFRLNEQGKRLADAKAAQYPEVWNCLATAAKTFRTAGELDYMRLSVAAKTYFLLGQKKGRTTEAQLSELASRFGWQVSATEILDAAGYLQKLGLVQLIPH